MVFSLEKILQEERARDRGYKADGRYGFEELSLHKIMLRVFAFNQAAIKAYEKAGFVQEAYLKDEEKIGDEFFDIIFMAMFNN